jgi:hypothetical protein
LPAARSLCLNLTYRVRVSGGEWHDVEETVRIVRIPCRFGGSRPYFICPGIQAQRLLSRGSGLAIRRHLLIFL